MSRALASLLSLLVAPGCLVSFDDYPLGEPAEGGTRSFSSGGAGGGAAARNPRMIDDFEDGNPDLPAFEGLSGSWYAANDGRGVQTPAANAPLIPSAIVPPRAGSARGARTFGGPFQTWGALIGTTLSTREGARVAYDVSAYDGVRLWVRSGSSMTTAARGVRLNLLTPATLPGGGCSECNDHFGATIPLTSEWKQVEVRFSALAQAGFGVPRAAAPDLTSVLALELLFPRGVSFDLWVDDIELF